jgi:DNA-directed RNA polymerase specialized sigma24 family protein
VTRLTDIVIADEVLTRARAGCEAAQQAIYAALAPATLTLIRRLVGQRALAEDIFQDTMMTFYERLPQFRREAPLKTRSSSSTAMQPDGCGTLPGR